jgi:DNA-binding NarL/FixJ family response regulator
VRTVLVVDDSNFARVDADVRPDVIVVDGDVALLQNLKAPEHPLADVPAVMLIETADGESWLRATIEGAVSVVSKPVDMAVLARALDHVAAPGALPEAQQRYRARIEALEAIARSEAHGHDHPSVRAGERVHLTRLEHAPTRAPESAAGAELRREYALCTDHQRELVAVIARHGSVSRAAAELGASRSSTYASLRRIVHRLHLRDTSELLRLVATGRLP